MIESEEEFVKLANSAMILLKRESRLDFLDNLCKEFRAFRKEQKKRDNL